MWTFRREAAAKPPLARTKKREEEAFFLKSDRASALEHKRANKREREKVTHIERAIFQPHWKKLDRKFRIIPQRKYREHRVSHHTCSRRRKRRHKTRLSARRREREGGGIGRPSSPLLGEQRRRWCSEEEEDDDTNTATLRGRRRRRIRFTTTTRSSSKHNARAATCERGQQRQEVLAAVDSTRSRQMPAGLCDCGRPIQRTCLSWPFFGAWRLRVGRSR